MMFLIFYTLLSSYAILGSSFRHSQSYHSIPSRISLNIRLSNIDCGDELERSDISLVESLAASGKSGEKLNFKGIFECFANSTIFKNSYWQKKPFLCTAQVPDIVHSFTMEDVKKYVDNDFLEAGRGTFAEGKGGWNMAAVSQPRGKTFEEAKLRFEDVQMAMRAKSGTVVFNSAGGFVPPLAHVCKQATEAFDLPVALNMYLTAAGQQTSAPPHTDKQDVFVMQTQGQKHWRVFAPPPPKRMPRADPFARGKATDQLDLRELDTPLLDVVLSPGQVLYVPGGFPHTTDTVIGVSSEEPSVHLTIGVDTHIWKLSYASLREAVLARNSMQDKVVPTKLEPDVYWLLQECLPVGFLQSSQDLCAGLGTRLRMVEPSRWPASQYGDDESLARSLGSGDEEGRFRKHHRVVTDIFRSLYADVALKLTPVQMDLSLFRSKPYFDQLEQYMDSFTTSFKSGEPEKKGKASKVR